MSGPVHYDIVVKGKVQGVGFRKFVYNTAISYSIKGFVKNMNDGTVYIEAEAPLSLMEIFIRDIEKGNKLSIVDGIEKKISPLKNFNDFDIIY
ncbi:MAG: acylphosphatase [Chitinophagales bacterium]|nr:acylphosphatase [Chitinophagales bacterium]MDW8274408.1 acylphosphatase [Chitinophagales bacterium]